MAKKESTFKNMTIALLVITAVAGFFYGRSIFCHQRADRCFPKSKNKRRHKNGRS